MRRRLRIAAAWALTLLVLAVYFILPEGEGPNPLAADVLESDSADEPKKLDVVEVKPADASPGTALVIRYVGAGDEATTRPFLSKQELEVLARRPGTLVARLPADTPPGRVKIRVASGDERSKPYDLSVRAFDWRKPFRNLVGGFALLVFGIGIFARGAREAAGLKAAHILARVAGRGPAVLWFGTILGALAQSTTAAAGLLAGLVSSCLLAVGPAAAAFLGAQLGAATAPLAIGVLDLREGLLIVAIGVLWQGLASDRRSAALGSLVLGAGLIAFGLQTMRPGFDLFVFDPTLLSTLSKLRVDGVLDLALAGALGAALVAVFQGPAPVLVLVLALAQTTGQWDLKTALAVLSGAGLGASIGALLTTPSSPRGRRFAELNLLVGAASSLLALATIDLWIALADRLVTGSPHELSWGKRVLLPNLGWHLGVAFALSQLGSALVLFPGVLSLGRWLERRWPEAARPELGKVGDAARVARAFILKVLEAQQHALESISDLTFAGQREPGRTAEHRLSDARSLLEGVLSGPVLELPKNSEGDRVHRTAFSCLQLERSLEALLYQAERYLDSRIIAFAGHTDAESLLGEDQATLRQMHELLTLGIETAAKDLAGHETLELDAARDREIRMNALESRARETLMARRLPAHVTRSDWPVLELVDAYETAGNQLYRLAEALGDDALQSARVAV